MIYLLASATEKVKFAGTSRGYTQAQTAEKLFPYDVDRHSVVIERGG